MVLQSPIQAKRSKLFSLAGRIVFQCVNEKSSLRNEKIWRVFAVDRSTGLVLYEVDLGTNPSKYYAELVLEPNTLSYGLFKLVFGVKLAGMSTAIESFTYLEIVPTGLALSAFKNAVNEITFGLNQTIQLKPVLYSIDLDSLADMSKLRFYFYCRTVDSANLLNPFPTSSGALVDLFSIKSGAISYALSNINSCFDSASQFYFDSDNNTLNIEAYGLGYVLGRQYEFLVRTLYLNSMYESRVRVMIQNTLNVPGINLK